MSLPFEVDAYGNNSSGINIRLARETAEREFEKFARRQDWEEFSAQMDLISYNAIRNNWIATFHSWFHPDYYVGVQYANRQVHVNISKMLRQDIQSNQEALPGL